MNDESPAIGSILPYYGAKRAMAKQIVDRLGPHSAYWELCCGSMAVLMAKPRSAHETVVDLYGELLNLARVLQDPGLRCELIERLEYTLAHERLWKEACDAVDRRERECRWGNRNDGCGGVDDGPDVEAALQMFLCSWLGRSGLSGCGSVGHSLSIQYGQSGGSSGRRFASTVECIEAWGRRLRGVLILERSAIKVASKIRDEPGTLIYADPPYYKKSCSYVVDFDEDHHAKLAAELGRFRKARVLVSYYDHAVVRSLYHGWNVVELPMPATMAKSSLMSPGAGQKTPEILLINGPEWVSGTKPEGLFA